MTCKEHPKYELPNTPHAKHRYESAMKHVEAAKAAGKSSEEIHAIFKKVMEFDIKDVEKLPADGPHAKYRSAVIHAQKAIALTEESVNAEKSGWKINNSPFEAPGSVTLLKMMTNNRTRSIGIINLLAFSMPLMPK